MKIDAHQHFWRYDAAEFGWISDAMRVIRRDFLPEDLFPLLKGREMEATIAVQARQSIDETEWLLGLAGDRKWIAGVVGWVPLIEPAVEMELERLATYPKLKGIRHVLQGEPDEYMDRKDFNRGLGLLRQNALVYDLLVLERQLGPAIALVDRHPDQIFVLDHLAKPLIAAHQIEPWRERIQELAQREHVSCKLSGMVAEADLNAWTVDDLRPYFDVVLDAFGPKRLLFGSDWPVCTVAASYGHWVDTVNELVRELSIDERDAILGGNAAAVYRL